MKLPIYAPRSTCQVASFLAIVFLANAGAHAQRNYVKHAFNPSAGGSQFPQAPGQMPGALLAGGPAAARGDQFIDVEGNSIVMQANHCQSCPGGYGGGCPGGCPGAYGDPMAVDFGGYGEDQCGPHYFDVSFGAVFMQGEDIFKGIEAFATGGVAGPGRFLDPARDFEEYEPGWEVAARYDIGALALLEATYMGIYDIGYSDQVLSVDVAPGNVPFQLFTIFTNFGTLAPIDGISFGQMYAIDYEADLQSTEFSYRRYWVGRNPRISGTWLAGFRYLRFTDDFSFNSQALVIPNVETASLQYSGENDLVGFQFGGDAWLCLRQGLRIGYEGKAGIYNNRFKFANAGTFSAPTGPADFATTAEGNQVAFASETEVSLVADLLPSWSLRGGYRVMFLNSLVTGANNINQAALQAGPLATQEGLVFQGFHAGMEYIW